MSSILIFFPVYRYFMRSRECYNIIHSKSFRFARHKRRRVFVAVVAEQQYNNNSIIILLSQRYEYKWPVIFKHQIKKYLTVRYPTVPGFVPNLQHVTLKNKRRRLSPEISIGRVIHIDSDTIIIIRFWCTFIGFKFLLVRTVDENETAI